MRLAEPWWLILLALAVVPGLFAHGRPRIAWPTLQGFAPARSWTARLHATLPASLKG